MQYEPKLEQRAAQPYVAIRTKVNRAQLGEVLPILWPEIFAWLGAKAIKPGAPFIKYISVEKIMDIEVGLPVPQPMQGEGRIGAGSFPAGQYAVLQHSGPYDKLVQAHAAMLAWGLKNKITCDKAPGLNDRGWVARIESYITDPAAEPDPSKWLTELAFLTK